MRYSLDHGYFDVIDTEAKAYFLGLLYADGCVSANGASWRLRIGLHSQDDATVVALKDALIYEGPLHRKPTRTTLDLSSRQIGESLIKHGCVPRKSLILEFPHLQEVLIWHFLRGYFDGDGCLAISGRGARWTLVSTLAFLTKVADILREIGVNSTVFPQKRVHVLSVSGNRQISVLLERLYREANIFMSRKHEKMIAFNALITQIRPIRKRDRINNHQEIVDDYLAGMKVKNIESKHQITNSTMYKILNQYKIERRQVSIAPGEARI